MPLLKVEAAKLSNNDLLAGVIEEMIERDDLFAMLPFTQTQGKAYVYNREDESDMDDHLTGAVATAGIAFVDPYDTIPERATKFLEVTTNLRILAGDVDLDKFLMATMSDTNNQLAVQLGLKAKLIGRKFRQTLVTGDNSVNAKSFDGIKKLVTSGQTIAIGTNGGALTLDKLDELKDKIPYRPDFFMMRAGTYRAYKAALRLMGGAQPDQMMIENFGMMPAHDGVPIVINDYLPATEEKGTGTGLCSIYAMRCNEMDGLHGLYGGPNAGFTVEEIGTLENKDSYRWRIKWYASLALKSTKSLARLEGVSNV